MVGDSLIQRDLISLTSIQQIASRYARDIRAAVASINGFAESGTETMVRLWLEENKIPFVQQFIFNENQRADFLIGKRLILEVDSVTHHTSREQQQRDHDRDQYFHSLGYIVFRVTYDDVTKNWGVVSIRLMAIIARGDHLHRPVGIAA